MTSVKEQIKQWKAKAAAGAKEVVNLIHDTDHIGAVVKYRVDAVQFQSNAGPAIRVKGFTAGNIPQPTRSFEIQALQVDQRPDGIEISTVTGEVIPPIIPVKTPPGKPFLRYDLHLPVAGVVQAPIVDLRDLFEGKKTK